MYISCKALYYLFNLLLECIQTDAACISRAMGSREKVSFIIEVMLILVVLENMTLKSFLFFWYLIKRYDTPNWRQSGNILMTLLLYLIGDGLDLNQVMI